MSIIGNRSTYYDKESLKTKSEIFSSQQNRSR